MPYRRTVTAPTSSASTAVTTVAPIIASHKFGCCGIARSNRIAAM